jgi:hypothetical protein
MNLKTKCIEPEDNVTEYINPFLIEQIVESESVFISVMNKLFSLVHGKVKVARRSEEESEDKRDRELGKLHVMNEVYSFLKKLKQSDFEEKTEKEIKEEIKQECYKLLARLEQESKTEEKSSQYKEGMEAANNFFYWRFSVLTLLLD